MQYVHNRWVYFKITKVIYYGLKPAGKLANNLLTERLPLTDTSSALLLRAYGNTNGYPLYLY